MDWMVERRSDESGGEFETLGSCSHGCLYIIIGIANNLSVMLTINHHHKSFIVKSLANKNLVYVEQANRNGLGRKLHAIVQDVPKYCSTSNEHPPLSFASPSPE